MTYVYVLGYLGCKEGYSLFPVQLFNSLISVCSDGFSAFFLPAETSPQPWMVLWGNHITALVRTDAGHGIMEKMDQKSPCKPWLIFSHDPRQDQLCQHREMLLQPVPRELPARDAPCPLELLFQYLPISTIKQLFLLSNLDLSLQFKPITVCLILWGSSEKILLFFCLSEGSYWLHPSLAFSFSLWTILMNHFTPASEAFPAHLSLLSPFPSIHIFPEVWRSTPPSRPESTRAEGLLPFLTEISPHLPSRCNISAFQNSTARLRHVQTHCNSQPLPCRS